MKHEQLQKEFYQSFEGKVRNPHIHADHLADEAGRTFKEIRFANQHGFGESIRDKVRAARYARENRLIALEKGVSYDDIH